MRIYPVGAEMTKNGVHFRLFAPNCTKVEIEFVDSKALLMHPEGNGYFSLMANRAAGTYYRFRLDGKESFPDPASRFQPEGPAGYSQVIDATQFQWKDQNWKGVTSQNQVIYEMHVGTFTEEGNWKSAIDKLFYLKEIGITVIELMPIGEYPGRFNWGYDGVCLFAPSHNYGTPDELRLFIQSAHDIGIGVILDVVYNHFGPEGNYMDRFADDFFTKKKTEWGRGINYQKKEVRDFIIANGCYWVSEFHFDGFRIDACHAVEDSSSLHILAEFTQSVRNIAGKKSLFISGENEQQEIDCVKEYGFDAIWNEDFHHSAAVRLGKDHEAYLRDYRGTAQEFLSSAKYGFLYQGQWYEWQKKERGTPCLDCAPHCFINFLENHDQVANLYNGKRTHLFSHPAEYRLMTALFLLFPQTPLLFQGQEFHASSPFYYFFDFDPSLTKKVKKGRLKFLSQFPKIKRSKKVQAEIPLGDETSFRQSKIDWSEREKNQEVILLHKDLIALRKEDIVLQSCQGRVDGAVINENCFLLRFFSENGERLLLCNFGSNHILYPAAEPLLAPPKNGSWKILWSSESTKYGGSGHLPLSSQGNWELTGRSALLLATEGVSL